MKAAPVFALLLVNLFSAGAMAAPPAISDLRIAFELRDKVILVREMINLQSGESGDKSIDLPLPRNAINPMLSDEYGLEGIQLNGAAVTVTPPIPAEGRTIAVVFGLPIVDGRTELDQQLGHAVSLAHVAYIGESRSIQIKGAGFGAVEENRIPSGLPALFTVGQNFDDGHIRLEIAGLEIDTPDTISRLATLLSFGILSIGFVFWLKRRREA